MIEQVLSISQMLHLKKLGIDTSNASMALDIEMLMALLENIVQVG